MYLLNTLFIRSALERMGAAKQTQPFQRRLRMQLHANAKTTPKARALWVALVLTEAWTYPRAAEAAGVRVRTVAKWVSRFRRNGASGLRYYSSRPRRHPAPTPAP